MLQWVEYQNLMARKRLSINFQILWNRVLRKWKAKREKYNNLNAKSAHTLINTRIYKNFKFEDKKWISTNFGKKQSTTCTQRNIWIAFRNF